MTPNDIVYNEVYKGCIRAGVAEYIAKDTAVMALQKFKNNQFDKPSKLIEKSIKDAKSRFKKSKK